MLGALAVLTLLSEDRFRRKEKLDLRAAATWKSPLDVGTADGLGEPSLVWVLECILEGVVPAILITRGHARYISERRVLCACNLATEKEGLLRSK